jgi:hypothetical protein
MGMIEDKDIELHIDRETLLQEYIPRKDYENRLKADMVAILTDLRLEIEKVFDNRPLPCSHYQRTLFYGEVDDLILDKINVLKGDKDGVHEN